MAGGPLFRAIDIRLAFSPSLVSSWLRDQVDINRVLVRTIEDHSFHRFRPGVDGKNRSAVRGDVDLFRIGKKPDLGWLHRHGRIRVVPEYWDCILEGTSISVVDVDTARVSAIDPPLTTGISGPDLQPV